MEQMPNGYRWEKPDQQQLKQELATAEHVVIFEKEGQTFEDHSYIFEPIVAYQDDLRLIEDMIGRRTARLADLEQRLVTHDGARAVDLPGLAQQVEFERHQVAFWKHAKAQTTWLFTEAVRRNAAESAALNGLSDAIEH